ncbi:AcvB/VirJ family lysyl-phosphatidylglycerol hydrolase [Mesorhizobium sp. NPDC059054]|uniref:AcvB/VirJ family lysyl-phosphatidylglycerol hydrolase n=1 Tax=Mesorhizobium sp. NPDC059054 TaxID=3346711 RepID=UPI00369CE400
MKTLFLSLLVSLCCAGLAHAQSGAPPSTLSVERLQNVRLLPSKGDAKAMVVYFSDRGGWTPKDDTTASALAEDGNVVLGVDLAAYAGELDKADGVCLYVVGEITDLAQTAQRQLNIQTYLPPIVAGTGEGATFAYAALADAPANTLGGAVASGFADRLTLRLPFCPGSTASKTADGKAWSYAFDKAMPEAATLFVAADTLDTIRSQASQQPDITVAALDDDNAATQIVGAVSSLVDAIEPFGKLPAVDLPSTTTPPKAVAIFISGDGGWRDIDKTMGEWLSTQGVHVVGLDALHYFWSRRRPEELAADITTLVKDADPQATLPVMLIGYSFGADTLPLAYPLLSKDLQGRTKVIALMAPSLSTSLQVTITGWLGIDDSGYPVPPAIAALPKDKVLCIYGKEEDDSGCEDPAVKDITKIETDGGHHFDGDYQGIARRFLDKL